MRDRWLVAISGAGTACFVACFGISIVLYPGGTWFDRHAPGHSFWKNFLCDLMQTHALNGEAAPVGSLFARFGSLAMFIALAAFCVQISRFESSLSRAGRISRGAGLVASVFGCAIPFVPSDLFRDAHVVTVVCAFVPGIVAAVAGAIVCMRASGVSRWVRGLAILTLGFSGLDGLLYGFAYAQAYHLVPPVQRLLINESLPLFQRVATLLLLGWVVMVCIHTSLSENRRLPP